MGRGESELDSSGTSKTGRTSKTSSSNADKPGGTGTGKTGKTGKASSASSISETGSTGTGKTSSASSISKADSASTGTGKADSTGTSKIGSAGSTSKISKIGQVGKIGQLGKIGQVGKTSTRPAPLPEFLALILWLLVFTRIHSAEGKDIAAATSHARGVQSVERTLHLNIERSANIWLAAHTVFAHLATYIYRLYYVAILGVLLWTFIRHPAVYRKARRTLVAMTALILPVYWLFPASPPRFALPGIVDIVARYDILGSAAKHAESQNHYSAMPSLHVGWALWCAYAAWLALRAEHPRLALLPWLFPIVMTAVVLGTGNHYVLDVVGSIVLITAAILAASITPSRQRRQPPPPAQPQPSPQSPPAASAPPRTPHQ